MLMINWHSLFFCAKTDRQVHPHHPMKHQPAPFALAPAQTYVRSIQMQISKSIPDRLSERKLADHENILLFY
jgi:hypothetical protein